MCFWALVWPGISVLYQTPSLSCGIKKRLRIGLLLCCCYVLNLQKCFLMSLELALIILRINADALLLQEVVSCLSLAPLSCKMEGIPAISIFHATEPTSADPWGYGFYVFHAPMQRCLKELANQIPGFHCTLRLCASPTCQAFREANLHVQPLQSL